MAVSMLKVSFNTSKPFCGCEWYVNFVCVCEDVCRLVKMTCLLCVMSRFQDACEAACEFCLEIFVHSVEYFVLGKYVVIHYYHFLQCVEGARALLLTCCVWAM